jgi:hypothetical protein
MNFGLLTRSNQHSYKGIKMKTVITDHAVKRAKDRFGINRKSLLRIYKKLSESVSASKSRCPKRLYNYIQSKITGPDIHVILQGDRVFLMRDENNTQILITVYLLPRALTRYMVGYIIFW